LLIKILKLSLYLKSLETSWKEVSVAHVFGVVDAEKIIQLKDKTSSILLIVKHISRVDESD
jgi:hypothetical protein